MHNIRFYYSWYDNNKCSNSHRIGLFWVPEDCQKGGGVKVTELFITRCTLPRPITFPCKKSEKFLEIKHRRDVVQKTCFGLSVNRYSNEIHFTYGRTAGAFYLTQIGRFLRKNDYSQVSTSTNYFSTLVLVDFDLWKKSIGIYRYL